MPGRLLRAALMVPRGLDPWPLMAELNAYAERHGWKPSAWVRDWTDLIAATARCQWCGMGGGADIGLVPSYDHLAPDRTPRLVTMDDGPPPPGRRPAIRRPSWAAS